MEYSISEKNNTVIFSFKGNIMGGPSSSEFREKINSLIEEGKTNVIGDFSGVDFMNSSGLGILIATLTTLRKAGGDFKLCSATERVRSLLKVSKLFTVFDSYKTQEEAIVAFNK